MNCPYCGNEARYGPNEEWYGKRYGKSYMCYYCKPCDAYVGTHQNTPRPLGTMANKELRQYRMKVHEKIDPLWKNGEWRRGQLYSFISKKLGYEYHTGESDIETCKKILTMEF